MRVLFGGALSVALFLTTFAGGPKKSILTPPAQSTRDSRTEDINTCIAQAKADLSSLKPLDDDALLLLQGHHTEGFVREGRPVVNRDEVPVVSGSLFAGKSGLYGPAELSDRYVVCLLKRGYTWSESSSVSPEPAPPREAESAAKPRSQPEITKISLGHYPQGIAFTPGTIWVAYSDERKPKNDGVFRVDPNTREVVNTVQTGKGAAGAAAGEGTVWIANIFENSVTRIDAEKNLVTATIVVGKWPFGVDLGEGSVWVTNAGSNTVSRTDPRTNTVIATIPVGKRPAGIAVEGGLVWVANAKSSSVSCIDSKNNAVVTTIKVAGEPKTVTARGTDVWISSESRSGFSVARIDAKSNRVVATIVVGTSGHVGGTAVLDGVLWVADRGIGALWEIDVQTNAVVGGPIAVGPNATILGVGTDGKGSIWLSNSSAGTVSRVKP